MRSLLIFSALLPLCARGQSTLSLKDAVRMALERNKAIAAADAADKGAGSRIAEARAGFLPKLDYSESWTRSNNPVFVFSSLLTQHQFEQQNFLIGTLNRPGFLNNFQSLVTVEQPIYDAGKTKHALRGAELTKNIAGEDRRLTETEVIANVVRTYYDALLSESEVQAATEALKSAQTDLGRAESIRSVGMSTDVDVLSIRVHLASVQEQQIRKTADRDVARAALNDALGMPLDARNSLSSLLTPLPITTSSLPAYEEKALRERPEARQMKLATSLAENEAAGARNRLLPEVVVRGAFEADRQQFYNQGGANWLVSAGLKWNLFNGLGDKARIEETHFSVLRREAEQQRTGSSIRLQVRRAYADLQAAQARIDVTKASVAEAQESLRITQNRYGSGMNSVTDLLRTETALLEARTSYLSAVHDERIAAALLEMTTGTLSASSEVLN